MVGNEFRLSKKSILNPSEMKENGVPELLQHSVGAAASGDSGAYGSLRVLTGPTFAVSKPVLFCGVVSRRALQKAHRFTGT